MSIATTFKINKVNAYRNIYEQFFDDASFLWILRSIAVDQPHFDKSDIFELEQRIEAHLDGLILFIEVTWEICLEGLELEEPGEVFTSAIVAFKSHDTNKIQKVVDTGLINKVTFKGLVSALGWLPGKLVHAWIKKFLTSKDLNHKYLALAACSVRRENPAEYLNKILEREDCKAHSELYARALRLIGELRRLDLMPELNEGMKSDNPSVKFWAIWSAILLGNRTAVTNLKPYVFKTGNHQDAALKTAFRVLSIEQARGWITELSEDKEQVRTVIKATGVLGDPHAVNWLITKMEEQDLARLAGEAFTAITGIDLEKNQLVDENPPELSQQPNDDEADGNVSMDEDENLPYPDTEKVKSMWINQGKNFITAQRYFLGKAISPDVLSNQVNELFQRQRHAVAMELALNDSSVNLQNTRAKINK